MAADKYLLVLCVFGCLCCVTCDLNLSEKSPCVTKGLNGTCVNIFNCSTAALTYLYTNAGFDREKYNIPELPDICSFTGKEPVVCCTDCEIDKTPFRNQAIGPMGTLYNKDGPVSRGKCLDYFQRLPYNCRGSGNIKVKKEWNDEKKCHTFRLEMSLAVGGRDAERWEFPHMALIGYGDDVETAQWLCGGTVISERFILTAAHCSSTHALGNISFAALGLLKRTDPKEYWKIHKIKRIVIHPEYKAPSKYHDIALLETETEIKFGRDLLPACLVSLQRSPNPYAEASGWGRLGHNKGLADVLQAVEIDEYSAKICAELYPQHRHLQHGYDHEKQMCYGSRAAIIDTCQGDSGGPLQTNQYKCLYTVIGVTSYGKDCGILGSPGMYTRVSYYVPWIESVVWPEETEARKKVDDEWLNKWLNNM